jgi:hypothetical protein
VLLSCPKISSRTFLLSILHLQSFFPQHFLFGFALQVFFPPQAHSFLAGAFEVTVLVCAFTGAFFAIGAFFATAFLATGAYLTGSFFDTAFFVGAVFFTGFEPLLTDFFTGAFFIMLFY